MLKFGNKDDFAIWYEPFHLIYDTSEYPKLQVQGRVWFWVKGVNIFEYSENTGFATYEDNLYRLTNFLSDNLLCHLFADDFPADIIAGKNGVQLEKHYYNIVGEIVSFDGDDMVVNDLTPSQWDFAEILGCWGDRHSLARELPGVIVPHAIFRKLNDCVEISWCSEFEVQRGDMVISMRHKEGCGVIDRRTYSDVVLQFCHAFVENAAIIDSIALDFSKPYLDLIKREMDVFITGGGCEISKPNLQEMSQERLGEYLIVLLCALGKIMNISLSNSVGEYSEILFNSRELLIYDRPLQGVVADNLIPILKEGSPFLDLKIDVNGQYPLELNTIFSNVRKEFIAVCHKIHYG